MKYEFVKTSGKEVELSKCSGPDEILIVPDNVTIISESNYRHYACPNLEKMVLPEGIRAKSEFTPLDKLPSLKEIEVHPDNKELASRDGVVFSRDLETLRVYPPNRPGNYEIPAETLNIGYYAFGYCQTLTQIHIPKNIQRLERGAFAHCTNLEEIIIEDGVQHIEVSAFGSCTSLKSITIPGSMAVLGKPSWRLAIFQNCSELEYVEFSEGVKEIDSYVFENCPKLTRIALPKSIERVHKLAFFQCENLKEIIIPAELLEKKKVIQNLNKEAKLIAKEDGRILRDPDSLNKPEVQTHITPASKKKGASGPVWALSETQKSFKQCSVALKCGKTYAYASKYAIKQGNIAVIGTEMKDTAYRGATSGQIGKIAEIAQKFTADRGYLLTLDFAFTDAPTTKTLKGCEELLKSDPSEDNMSNDPNSFESHILHPITFLTKKVFAALTLLSNADQTDASAIELATQFLQNGPCNDDIMQKIEAIQRNPHLAEKFEFNFWEGYFPNTKELKASLDSLVKRGMLKTGYYSKEDSDSHIYRYNKPSQAIIKYMNEGIWAGAINIMVQAGMNNLLDALLQVSPKLKTQVKKIKEVYEQ